MADDLTVSEQTEKADTSDVVEQPLPVANTEQLAPELQSDLVAVEADNTAVSTKKSTEHEESVPVSKIEASAESKESAHEPSKPQSTATTLASVGTGSIPQQYREEPSTSEESSGSIYDTDTYHQPLAHPVKTKSGWLWIIWILLLLLVGGGGAVALYFVGII